MFPSRRSTSSTAPRPSACAGRGPPTPRRMFRSFSELGRPTPAALPPHTSPIGGSPNMPDETIDVTIVGGGVSGVYSAWRLKKADPKRKIAIFEGSNHIGGRLLSVTPPDIPNMVAELGGMRILPAVQPLIKRLIDLLNEELPPNQKIELYDFPVDEPQNIAYLRGVYLRLSDFTTNPDKVPYHLSFLERGGTAGSIIVNAIEQIVPGITNPDLDEYQRRQMARNASFAGVPLYRQGFWN